jgi:TolB protein
MNMMKLKTSLLPELGTRLAAFLAITFLIALPVIAQTDITTTINPNQSLAILRIAIPSPTLGPSTAEAGAQPATFEVINPDFFAPLTRDIAASGVFAIAPLPPNINPAAPDLLKNANAQLLLRLNVFKLGEEFVIEVRMVDSTGATQYGKRYRGQLGALSRIAHTIANEMVRAVNGKPGIFLSQIAYASNRTGSFEIWLMDWDGANQREITRHNALSILPSWSADNERMVYTSFTRGTSEMYIINRRGGGRIRVTSGLGLNTSATFSPVSNDIAFVGSVRGNPDIYVIKDDSTNLRRLTTSDTIESTPEWSPTGRQISFTSGRSGTPQIYVMDAEGSNVRRISFEGDWNDDATWSPDGQLLAYTSKVSGRFQIRIMNLLTNESRVLAGEASNEQPTWSPDGRWLAFQSNRSGQWQIYKMRVDGTDLLQLTFTGENKDPDWSKKIE